MTGGLNSHWICVMPTMNMGEADRDFAIVGLVPGDADDGHGVGLRNCLQERRDVFHLRGAVLQVDTQRVEALARGQWRLVITELPPGVSAATVMSEIEACSNPVAKEKAGKKVFTPEQLNLKAAFLAAISESGVW